MYPVKSFFSQINDSRKHLIFISFQVESTYVIRPPVGYKHHVQPQKPRPGTISIPTNQNYNLQSYNLQSHNLQSHNLQSHNLQSYNLPSHNLQSHNLQSQNLQSYNNPSSYDNHATYGYNDVHSFMNQYDVPSFYSKPSMSQVRLELIKYFHMSRRQDP